MEKGDILNVVLLCTINVAFMIAGIFLNSVVIISLCRSRQLRKKLCYFMVLVLSCFDLAVVTITHPLVVTSTIYLPIEETQKIRENIRVFCTYILTGFLMSALFTLTIERFLALARPFFHQAFVTKRKIVSYLILSSITLIGKSSVIFIKAKTVMIACEYSHSYLGFKHVVFLNLCKLQNVCYRKVEKSGQKESCKHRKGEKRKLEKANLKSQKCFYMFFSSWLLPVLFMPIHGIFSFTLGVRNVVIRKTSSVI